VTTTASNLPIAPAAAKQRWVLALTSVASLMVGLDILVVTTTLTTIHLKLGASLGELEWIINAYTLSFAVLLMTASALGDRFGRRRLFLAKAGGRGQTGLQFSHRIQAQPADIAGKVPSLKYFVPDNAGYRTELILCLPAHFIIAGHYPK